MLNSMFYPKRVVIIGASNTPGKVGYSIVKNLIESNFDGDIYPVNLKEKDVQGLRAYESVLKIKNKIDLAIIVVPSKIVPQEINNCAKKKIKNAVIITAGFGETGEQGKQLEEEIKKIVEKNKMNVVGPNTLGIINSENGLNASFSATFPREGQIAIVSQSGAICTAILDWARQEKIGFSKFISTGNKSFLEEKDYFRYLENDTKTKAVLVYMESVKHQKEFMLAAKNLSKKKPIVLIKSGRSKEGMRAASSHTGAMSVDDNVFTIACKKVNIMRMNSIEGFFDMGKLLSKIDNIKGVRLAVVTNAGGPGVIVADSASKHEFTLPEFTKKTLDVVKQINPNAANPLDLIGDAKPIDYRSALTVLQEDNNVDLVYTLLTPQSMTDPDRVAEIIVELNQNLPILCSFLGGTGVEHARRYLREHGVVEYTTPERGIKALSILKNYIRKKNIKKAFEVKLNPKTETKKLISKSNQIEMKDAFSILKEFGIKTCKTEFVNNISEFDNAIKKINFPVAMKASSGIVHKTDLGLVKANIKNLDDAKKEFIKMQNILSKLKKPKEIAIQEMVEGQEILVSSITTNFGKLITYGLGGIFVEVMKDFSQKIAPINDSDVEEMFNEVKGKNILLGARTKKKYNILDLKKVIKLTALLAQTYPEIKEIEMNPIIVNETGAYAVDAIMIK